MPYGYSHKFAEAVKERYSEEPTNPIYTLCMLCVEHDIMMSEVAASLEVSKQTLYHWFNGDYNPRPEVLKRIEKLNRKLFATHT